MTKLKEGDLWLKDFGKGVATDKDKAYEFTGDEAYALTRLYDFTTSDPLAFSRTVLNTKPPFNPGDDMVWVQYNGCWFAAERQALFMGTRNALNKAKAEEPRYA